ncbi:hypothetical protein HMPREF1136_1594 [Actinomyces sp. ICM47]|nr:hypothetical protein HMPREF1136_1594 [Actinomyces sp. ICM47]
MSKYFADFQSKLTTQMDIAGTSNKSRSGSTVITAWSQ